MTDVADKPSKLYIAFADEIQGMHPHGQWSMDQPGSVLNFMCDLVDDTYPDIEPWARKLEAFKRIGPVRRWLWRHSSLYRRVWPDNPDWLMFEAPHLPGICYMHRATADHIFMTMPAWSRKVLPRTKENGGVELLDAGGIPIIRKLPRAR